MIKATFYNRDYSNALTPPGAKGIVVERYAKSAIGLCKNAYLTIPSTADNWELMKLLRCPIELYGDDGGLKWWGFVNRVTIPIGEVQRVGLSLDEMYNYVIARYASTATAAASDTQSIAEYGQKEISIYVSNSDATQAAAARDLHLQEHQYPRPEYDFSGGSQDVSIECKGWYDTLGWQYYSDSDQTNTSNTDQISAIVTAKAQFLNGAIIEDAAGVSSNEYRDGTGTSLGYINQLLGAGTSNGLPLIAYVDKNRYLHVYERTAEPTTPDYIMRSDNTLVSLVGQKILAQDCTVGVWAGLKDVSSLTGMSSMRPFFIESAEYNAATDKTTYRPAGSFEQARLAKFIQSVTDRSTGGGRGRGGVSSGSNYGYSGYSGYGAPPLLEGSLGEVGTMSLPYASVFLSASGDASSSSGITIDSATRTGTGVNVQVTADAATGIYLVSAGTGGLPSADGGWANLTVLGAGYPAGHSAACDTNSGDFVGACVTALIINPTGGVITLAGDVWNYGTSAYLTPSLGWFTIMRLGDA